jgi:carboxypeptidase family protein
MKNSLLLAVVLALLLISLTAAGFSSDHSVFGIVTDTKGSVVKSASVTAVPIESGGSAGDLGWVHVDNNGGFRLILKPGRYVIRAKDEADGYPDPNFLLCADPSSSFPQVLVEQSDVSGVRASLGTQGGTMEGEVLDASTQRRIAKARLTIRDAQDHSAFVEFFADETGHFRFTVPSKPVDVTAAAAGYHTTRYHGGEAMALSGGEHRSMVIELRSE